MVSTLSEDRLADFDRREIVADGVAKSVWIGCDGAVPDAEECARIRRACISAEFRAFGGAASSPLTRWLMGLGRQARYECGGPGVGAIGMCFTGNFALTMMLEPAVLGPVLCQPSLPPDVFCRAARFEAYARALSDRFVPLVLFDAAASREVPPFFAAHVPTPHSVVTAHLIDQAGQPTIAARDEILVFFQHRLAARAQPGTAT